MQLQSVPSETALYVRETKFGKWFLGTHVWEVHVLGKAIADLKRLISNPIRGYPVDLDVGCGWGHSFRLLKDGFSPSRIVGVDVCPEMIAAARMEASRQDLPIEIHRADCARLPLQDQSIDLLFCHQTFHHLVAQQEALAEFHRVLKPGGLFLFAESTRAYIHSWIIRLLFRHPMDVQRTASEYIDMVRSAGFQIDDDRVSYPYLWWSRPDLGLLERIFGAKPTGGHAETLINLVASRPLI